MKPARVLSVLAFASLIQNCAGFDSGVVSSASTWVADEALQTEAVAALSSKCATCHGTSTSFGGVKDITNVSKLISEGLIVPSNPDQSKLIQSVSSDLMPPAGSPDLTADEKQALSDWVLSFKGGSQSPGATPQPEYTPLAPTYASLRVNVLNRCTSCHSPSGSRPQTNFSSYASLMSSGVIVTGNSSASSIYAETSTFDMPPTSDKLSFSELAALKDWIDAGAPNN